MTHRVNVRRTPSWSTVAKVILSQCNRWKSNIDGYSRRKALEALCVCCLWANKNLYITCWLLSLTKLPTDPVFFGIYRVLAKFLLFVHSKDKAVANNTKLLFSKHLKILSQHTMPLIAQQMVNSISKLFKDCLQPKLNDGAKLAGSLAVPTVDKWGSKVRALVKSILCPLLVWNMIMYQAV